MEPLSTFFRISPSLLISNFTTPRSQSSSSFSSPSFADHQTGLKAYRESPASLTSAHQDRQDNPLFEGFPVLPVGGRTAEPAEEEAQHANNRKRGGSPKLQDQLHHLLAVLQHALELHNGEGLPDDLAPQLADELEAVAKRLKEKERAMPVERHLRAKVQLALTGAEATIRKLRATPTRVSPAGSWGTAWHCNEAAESSPITAVPSGSRSSAAAGTQPTSTNCSGGGRGASMRDSVCRQLLQSPSSSMSPLSWNGPAMARATPVFMVDDTSMASPKELPTDQQRNRRRHPLAVASSCDTVMIPTGIPPMPEKSSPSSEGAASPDFQPPLYNWMKAALASPSKQNDVAADSGAGSDNSPGQADMCGDGLAAAVRVALSNTITPPLIYGTPLHRRIQRLLASRLSPSPLRHVGAQAGGALPFEAGVDYTPMGEKDSTYGSGSSSASARKPRWGRGVATDSTADTTDTSSSCHTPVMAMQDDLAFRSSISPFGPTLRERFTKLSTGGPDTFSAPAAAVASQPEEPETEESPAVSEPSQQQGEEQARAAELLAELGLDLQLDPATAGSISNLEVLEHVERWAREQFIAAKRALQATRGPVADDESTGSPASSGFSGCSVQALVDIAIQTEPLDTRLGLGSRAQPSQFSSTSQSTLGEARDVEADALGSFRAAEAGDAQFADKQSASVRESTAYGDAGSDDCTPWRADQAKRSPLAERDKYSEAATTSGRSPRDAGSGLASARAAWPCNRHASEYGSTPARRGLFRAVPSSSSVGESYTAGPDADHRHFSFSSRDRRVNRPAEEPRSPGPPVSQPEQSSCSDGSAHGRLGSPALLFDTGRVAGPQLANRSRSFTSGTNSQGAQPTRESPSSEELPPEVLFTPGVSHVGSRAATGRHFSRVFPTASGASRDHIGDQEDALPSSRVRSCGGSIRGAATTPADGEVTSGLGAMGGFAPSTSRGSRASGHAVSPRAAAERFEAVPEVLFTPGNAQSSGGKSFGGRRAAVPFHLGNISHQFDVEQEEKTEDGGRVSAQTLSSISSVSIIASEPVNLANPDADRRTEAQRGRAPPPKSFLSRQLLSFFTSLVPCSHGVSLAEISP